MKTQEKLNKVMEQIQNIELPEDTSVMVFIKECPKQEVKDVANEIGRIILEPKDKPFSNYYSFSVSIGNATIIVQSKEVKFKTTEI